MSACQREVAELLAWIIGGRSSKSAKIPLKQTNCSSNLLASASSAVAKWVKIPSTWTPADWRRLIAIWSDWISLKPIRPIPESTFRWTTKPCKDKPEASNKSSHSKLATVNVILCSTARGTTSMAETPKIKIFLSRPPSLNSKASSIFETQNPSTISSI